MIYNAEEKYYLGLSPAEINHSTFFRFNFSLFPNLIKSRKALDVKTENFHLSGSGARINIVRNDEFSQISVHSMIIYCFLQVASWSH